MALSDVYYQKPFVPGEGAGDKISNAFAMLPGIEEKRREEGRRREEISRA